MSSGTNQHRKLDPDTSSHRFIPGPAGLVAVLAIAILVLGLRLIESAMPEGIPLHRWFERLSDPTLKPEQRERLMSRLAAQSPSVLKRILNQARPRYRLLQKINQLTGLTIFPPGPSPETRRLALEILLRAGTNISFLAQDLIPLLTDPDPQIVLLTRRILREAGRTVSPILAASLPNTRPQVQQHLLELLADTNCFGPAAPQTRRFVAELARRAPPPLAQVAVRTLASWHCADRYTVETLISLSSSTNMNVALESIRALGTLKTHSQAVIEHLTGLLGCTNPAVQIAASRALWRLTHEPTRVLPVLTNVIVLPQYRWEAALALGELGPAAVETIPLLISLIPEDHVHRPDRMPASCALAMKRMGPSAVPALVSLLESPSLQTRLSAERMLTFFGTNAVAALPYLPRLLRSTSREERILACQIAEAIGPPAHELCPLLAEIVIEERDYLRGAAWDALLAIIGEQAAADLVSHVERHKQLETVAAGS